MPTEKELLETQEPELLTARDYYDNFMFDVCSDEFDSIADPEQILGERELIL